MYQHSYSFSPVRRVYIIASLPLYSYMDTMNVLKVLYITKWVEPHIFNTTCKLINLQTKGDGSCNCSYLYNHMIITIATNVVIGF